MALTTQPTGPLRHRTRHMHMTFFNHVRTNLTALGWVNTPTNFGTKPITLLDYQPDERTQRIEHNTVAVSVGDFDTDEDEELGAGIGGLRSSGYDMFIDVYMQDQAIAVAICDDIRDIYTDTWLPLINQISHTEVPNTRIEIEAVVGPDRPQISVAAETFKKYWRTMRVECRLYFNT